jgi:hypothetical protein
MRSRPQASSPPPSAASANAAFTAGYPAPASRFALRVRNGFLADKFLRDMMPKAGKDITNKIDLPDYAHAAA